MHRHFAVQWTLTSSCPRNVYLKITQKCSLNYHNLSGYTPVTMPSKIKEKFHNTNPDVFLFLLQHSLGEVGQQKKIVLLMKCIDHNEQSSLIPGILHTSINWMAGHTLFNAKCVQAQGASRVEAAHIPLACSQFRDPETGCHTQERGSTPWFDWTVTSPSLPTTKIHQLSPVNVNSLPLATSTYASYSSG